MFGINFILNNYNYGGILKVYKGQKQHYKYNIFCTMNTLTNREIKSKIKKKIKVILNLLTARKKNSLYRHFIR